MRGASANMQVVNIVTSRIVKCRIIEALCKRVAPFLFKRESQSPCAIYSRVKFIGIYSICFLLFLFVSHNPAFARIIIKVGNGISHSYNDVEEIYRIVHPVFAKVALFNDIKHAAIQGFHKAWCEFSCCNKSNSVANIAFPYLEKERALGGKNPYNEAIRLSRRGVFCPFGPISKPKHDTSRDLMLAVRIALVDGIPVLLLYEEFYMVIFLDYNTPIRIRLGGHMPREWSEIDIDEISMQEWHTQSIHKPSEVIINIEEDNTLFYKADNFAGMRALKLFDSTDYTVAGNVDSAMHTPDTHEFRYFCDKKVSFKCFSYVGDRRYYIEAAKSNNNQFKELNTLAIAAYNYEKEAPFLTVRINGFFIDNIGFRALSSLGQTFSCRVKKTQ